MTLLHWIQLPEKRTFPQYSEFFTKAKTLPIIELEGNHSIRGNRMGGIWCQRKKSILRVTTLKPIYEIKNKG